MLFSFSDYNNCALVNLGSMNTNVSYNPCTVQHTSTNTFTLSKDFEVSDVHINIFLLFMSNNTDYIIMIETLQYECTMIITLLKVGCTHYT